MISDKALFLMVAVIATIINGACTIFSARKGTRHIDGFRLIVPLGAWTTCIFGVVPIGVALLSPPADEVFRQWTAVVSWVTLGFIAFVVGYRVAHRLRTSSRTAHLLEVWDRQRTLIAVFALWLLGVIGNYLFYSHVGGVMFYTEHLAERVSVWGKGMGPIQAMRYAGALAFI